MAKTTKLCILALGTFPDNLSSKELKEEIHNTVQKGCEIISQQKGEFIVTSLDSPSWIRVGGRLTRASDQSDQRSDQRDMDSQVPVQEDTQFDTTVPPPPPHSQPTTQTVPFTLHSQTEVTPPSAIVPTLISENPHTHMDRLEQKLRQMRTSEGAITWEDFDGTPVASLPAKFRMPEIERYTGIGCPRIHLRLL
ncbi:hypothetical protein CK203_112505 [Vitis vinifera]|uniref:Uncharacterized protein n=1 Tax=Vitis vinifera TaxID=29760 RepID=A0A438CPN3_VITVI|nr:hypothetical protein CK203_112505 [Vitis vinifera]